MLRPGDGGAAGQGTVGFFLSFACEQQEPLPLGISPVPGPQTQQRRRREAKWDGHVKYYRRWMERAEVEEEQLRELIAGLEYHHLYRGKKLIRILILFRQGKGRGGL